MIAAPRKTVKDIKTKTNCMNETIHTSRSLTSSIPKEFKVPGILVELGIMGFEHTS